MKATKEENSDCCCKMSIAKRPYVELPAAPRINARLRFSRADQAPAGHLSPSDALATVKEMVDRGEVLGYIGIAGPGDPLAFIEPTLETLELIRHHFPSAHFFIRTLGIGGEKYADRLSKAGVTHIDLQVNAITEDILEKLYAWIRPGFKTLRLPDSAKILIAEQRKAVRAFKDAGMTVSVITTVYPENNSDHVESIAHQMAELGADDMVLVPYLPEEGAEIKLSVPDRRLMETLGKRASRYIAISEERNLSIPIEGAPSTRPGLPKPTPQRPNAAVVSSNGMDIDLHLGEATRVLIYGPREDGLACLLCSRPAPEPGGGETRWQSLAASLPDCFVLLAASAGENPRKILARHGIKVLITEDTIEGTVDVLYGGGKKKKKGRN